MKTRLARGLRESGRDRPDISRREGENGLRLADGPPRRETASAGREPTICPGLRNATPLIGTDILTKKHQRRGALCFHPEPSQS